MIDTHRFKELLARFEPVSEFAREIPESVPLSEAEIDAFEGRMGFPVPDDLREWLGSVNGAFVGTVVSFGVRTSEPFLDMESILNIFTSWREKKWLPVGNDGCGNYYVMITQGEYGEGFPIVFVEAVVDHQTPRYIVASDLGHFLIFLAEDELESELSDELEIGPSAWFDKQKVTHDDPAILRFHGIALPWEVDNNPEQI
ncbi:MAG: SMI1/KNR4 family protein [Planctomycetota bacterium]|nr:MAG: SMI1/KNR4 family protein [Planctomycetota bacterium]